MGLWLLLFSLQAMAETPCFLHRKAAVLLCTCNLVAIVCILYSLLSPVYYYSNGYPVESTRRRSRSVDITDVEAARIREALEARRALEPVKLIKRIKEIQEETEKGDFRERNSPAGRKKNVADLAGRLKQFKKAASKKNQQALEEWRKKKVDSTKMQEYGPNITDFS